jgi:hypothetical protein
VYLSEEQTYTSVLQKSIASLMNGVSTSDFSSWLASSARRRLLSDGDLIIPEHSEVHVNTQSAAVSITYVITVVNSNYNYDTLTGQLNSGLSAGR